MAFILAVQGVVWFILGSLAFVAVITNGSFNVYGASAAADSLDIISVTGLVSGVLYLFFAWALWTLKRWAYWATLLIEFLNIIAGGLLLTRPKALYAPGVGQIALSLIITFFVLACFLISSKVREAFGV
ncbi:MAG: hypothetical protein E6J04_13275 [Chloroflexi bacterium]|nr:MAG: hypothetical protein E6J04_13275 [Chloroflexota bacterium]